MSISKSNIRGEYYKVFLLLQLGVNPTNVDSVVVGKGNQVNTVMSLGTFLLTFNCKCPTLMLYWTGYWS